MMQGFLIALQFLTRFPISINSEWNDKNIANSLLFYPLVGLLMGGVLVLLASIMSARVDDMLAAALLLAAWVMLSGALHLDGLADSADAWCGSHGNKQRALDIMKDPQAGPVAVVVLLLVLLIKFSALYSLLKQPDYVLLIITLVVGRCVPLVLFLTTPYVRDSGLGSAMAKHLQRKPAWAVLLISVFCIVVITGVADGVLIMLISAAVLWMLRNLMFKNLQGMTGDTIGAAIEIIETVALCSAVFIAG